MKKGKMTKLLLAVLALAILAVIYVVLVKWNQDQEAQETETESTQDTVLSISSDEIEELVIQGQDGVLTFAQQDDTWSYEEDSAFPLDEDALLSMVDVLAQVDAVRTLEEPEDLSEYGLETPSLEVLVRTDDGEEVTLQIGDLNSSTGDYYAKLAGEDTVYTISSSVAGAFTDDLYELALADDFPTISSTTITGLTLEKDEEAITLNQEDTGWMIQEGDGWQEADSTKLNELTENAAALAFDNYVDYDAENLSEYGLEDPAMKLTINYTVTETVEAEDSEDDGESTDDADTQDETEEETESETETIEVPMEVTLEVGNFCESEEEDGEGYYYVKLSDSNRIHTMSESTISTWTSLAAIDCADSYVSDIPVTGMTELKVTYEGTTYSLTWKAENTTETDDDGEETTSTTYTYYVDGEEADSTIFSQFCNSAAAIQTQSRLNEEPEDLADATLTLEYTKTDGSTLKAEYRPYENGCYLVLVTGQHPGIVSKLDVEDLVGVFEELLP
jgi:hypothetical protein